MNCGITDKLESQEICLPSDCCSDRTHLDLCTAGFLRHVQQELSATQLDRSPASYIVNSFLAQTRDRLISKRQLAPGLGPGLNSVALANSLVDHHRAPRCTGWYHFNVLHYLSNLCFCEILGRHVVWQPAYQSECYWGDE